MDINEEQLQRVKQAASLFFEIEDVALFSGVDPSTIQQQLELKEGDIYKFYMMGRLEGEVLLRKSVLKMANSGSSPAQAMAMELLKQQQSDRIKHGS